MHLASISVNRLAHSKFYISFGFAYIMDGWIIRQDGLSFHFTLHILQQKCMCAALAYHYKTFAPKRHFISLSQALPARARTHTQHSNVA